MPRIAIASMFRNSESYIDRYVGQVTDLVGHLCGKGDDIHLIAAEGDSTDGTWDMLKSRLDYLIKAVHMVSPGSKLTMMQVNHGGPVFGSIDHEQRWRNISLVCNRILEAVERKDDYLIYVESDLIWDSHAMYSLLAHLEEPGIDAIAPICIHRPTGLNYETWGHRKDGQRFQANKPYHSHVGSDLTRIDSAGSCIVMHGYVARICRFTPPEQGIVGFGHDINGAGYRFWLDPTLFVHHP
jgi:hypothetical protein